MSHASPPLRYVLRPLRQKTLPTDGKRRIFPVYSRRQAVAAGRDGATRFRKDPVKTSPATLLRVFVPFAAGYFLSYLFRWSMP